MMIVRPQMDLIHSLSWQFPAVLVTGPRAAGKSTVCRLAFPQSKVLLLESPTVRSFVEADPAAIFAGRSAEMQLVLNGVQAWPDAFAWAKAEIDVERTRKGQFIFTGSQVFPLMKGVANGLAGRIAILPLYPLSWKELLNAGLTGYSIDQIAQVCVRGGFPELWADGSIHRDPWMGAYVDTYLLRDVMAVSGVQEIGAFRRFMGVLAPRAGSLLNVSEVARDAGIPESTARKWLSILESTYVIRLIQPYSANLSKRWIKAPKLYFIDTGLLCYLLGINRPEALLQTALFGHIMENLVISEIVKRFAEEEARIQLFFMRTRAGEEIDILLQRGMDLWAFEIKARSRIQASDFTVLKDRTSDLPNLRGRILLTWSPERLPSGACSTAHWADVFDIVTAE